MVDVRGVACSHAEALLQFGDWRVENGDEDFFETGAWEEYCSTAASYSAESNCAHKEVWARCILVEAFTGTHDRRLVAFDKAVVLNK